MVTAPPLPSRRSRNRRRSAAANSKRAGRRIQGRFACLEGLLHWYLAPGAGGDAASHSAAPRRAKPRNASTKFCRAPTEQIIAWNAFGVQPPASAAVTGSRGYLLFKLLPVFMPVLFSILPAPRHAAGLGTELSSETWAHLDSLQN